MDHEEVVAEVVEVENPAAEGGKLERGQKKVLRRQLKHLRHHRLCKIPANHKLARSENGQLSLMAVLIPGPGARLCLRSRRK